MLTNDEIKSLSNQDRELRRYKECLQQIHTAQKKNYPSFKEMIEDIQSKAFKALEN